MTAKIKSLLSVFIIGSTFTVVASTILGFLYGFARYFFLFGLKLWE